MSATGLYDNRFIANDAIDTLEIVNGALSADAAGRAKMAVDFFDAATLAAKIATNAFDATRVADLFANDSIDSAQYVAGSVDGEHISANGKQVVLQSKFLAAWKQVSNFITTAANNDNVDTEVKAAATVDIAQGAVTAKGVLTGNGAVATATAPPSNYIVQIKQNSDGQPINDGSGGEVYGVLSFQLGTTYQLNYYKSTNDAAHTFAAPIAIDFLFAEIFDLDDLPGTALLAAPSFGDINDLGVGSHTHPLTDITDVTATATEINQALDGITVNVTDINLNALTGGGETALHIHDGRYYTETEIGAIGIGNPNTASGAALIGTDASAIGADAGTTDTVQGVLEAFQAAIDALQTASTGHTFNELIAAEALTTDTPLTDTIASTPTAGTVQLYLNGARMILGVHYTVATNVITWLGTIFPMTAADTVRIDYLT